MTCRSRVSIDETTSPSRAPSPWPVGAARPCRHIAGSRWFVDETSVNVAGAWPCVYRAVDDDGQVVDVMVPKRRDITAARRFFTHAIAAHGGPDVVVTERAPSSTNVIADPLPGALHNTDQHANNRIESATVEARLRPMRGPKTDCTVRVLVSGHALILNPRRGDRLRGDKAMAIHSGVGACQCMSMSAALLPRR